MTLFDKLTQERRARLVAERRLEHRTRELDAALSQLEAARSSLHTAQHTQKSSALDDALRAAEAENAQLRAREETDAALRNANMAERRLWDSVNTIRDGFAVFNKNHEMVIANQAYLGVFTGYPEVQPGVPYRRLLEILAYEGRANIGPTAPEDWIAKMLERWTSERIDPMDLSFTRGDTARIHDRRARGGDIVSLVRDITEVQRHARELEEARTKAEAANRAKSAFLANMSHEIRTPMNGVVGMAELLCETHLSDEQRLYSETIRSSGEALLSIINDVLDFSKIEADKLTLLPEPFDLERCIHEVLILLQAGARKRSIDLLFDYDLFMPTRFLADPGRMRQVLTNLIGNAVKFTEHGHVLIRVVGIEAHDGQQQLHVTIEDTGIGIAPENIASIFGEFAQVEDQANRKFEGTGLGLAITKRLIEMMGGEIWVDSEPGAGSCFGFSLTLPLAEAAQTIQPAPIELSRVLVVDDHLVNRTILERQLTAHGLNVTTCATGADALTLLEHGQPFDLMITDHEMPELNGLDLTLMVRKQGYDLPILLLSSNPSVLRDHPAIPEFRSILQKPLLRNDLIQNLQQLTNVTPVAPPEASTDTPVEAYRSGRKMRILTAEDNKTNRLVFSKMVAGLDIDLTFAEDGLQAVEAFKTTHPDLIFMDISMPQLDGRDATRAIRQLPNGAQMPIIALTAHALPGDHEEMLAAGLDHVMTKPLKKPLLLDMIKRYQPPETCSLLPPVDKSG